MKIKIIIGQGQMWAGNFWLLPWTKKKKSEEKNEVYTAKEIQSSAKHIWGIELREIRSILF